jgi:hypothetical protein
MPPLCVAAVAGRDKIIDVIVFFVAVQTGDLSAFPCALSAAEITIEWPFTVMSVENGAMLVDARALLSRSGKSVPRRQKELIAFRMVNLLGELPQAKRAIPPHSAIVHLAKAVLDASYRILAAIDRAFRQRAASLPVLLPFARLVPQLRLHHTTTISLSIVNSATIDLSASE